MDKPLTMPTTMLAFHLLPSMDGYMGSSLKSYLEGKGHAVQTDMEGADVIVCELHGHEEDVRGALDAAGKTAAAGRRLVFIGISTPLTWATTTLAPHQLAWGGGDDEGPPPRLTEADAGIRQPAADAVVTHQTEQRLLRAAKATPGLRVHVVCPGLLYGQGEGEQHLASLVHQAWEGAAPLAPVGAGANRLPLTHVAELAAFVEAVALSTPPTPAPGAFVATGRAAAAAPQLPPPYLLVADPAPATQRHLAEALAAAFGAPAPVAAGDQAAGAAAGPSALLLLDPCSAAAGEAGPLAAPRLQLDLPFATTSWQGCGYACGRGGLAASAAAVRQEYLAARGLAPLRVLLRGPPCAGKTHAAARLASAYGIAHITPALLLQQLPLMEPEVQQAMQTELAAKEGRLSSRHMAALARPLLQRHRLCGWVMEGWPHTLGAARALFANAPEGQPPPPPPVAAAAPPEAKPSRPGAKAGGKDKDKEKGGAAGAKGKGAKAAAAAAAAAGEAQSLEGPVVYESEHLPGHVIELAAPDEELLRRLKALAAAEAPAAPPAGGKKASVAAAAAAAAAARSHNNERDFGRRLEAHRSLLADDAADAAARAAAVASAAGSPPGGAPGSQQAAGAAPSEQQQAEQQADGAEAPPPQQQQQQLGGFAAFFADGGVPYTVVANPCQEGVAAVPQPPGGALSAAAAMAAQPLAELEAAVEGLLGPPKAPPAAAAAAVDADGGNRGAADGGGGVVHPQAAGAAAERARQPAVRVAGAGEPLTMQDAAAGAGVDQLCAELAAAQCGRLEAVLAGASAPVRDWLLASVMPAVAAGLGELARTRDAEPLRVLAGKLQQVAADRAAALPPDPYDDPTYAIQEEKVRAKAEREAARAAAAAARAERAAHASERIAAGNKAA